MTDSNSKKPVSKPRGKAGQTGKSAAKRKKKAEKLTARITYLEMHQPMQRHYPVPTKPSLALIRAKYVPSDYYSFLYEMVGKAHHWEERRGLNDDKLYSIINDEHCEIHILYADGCPAGFFELDTSDMPKAVKIVYLGLGKDYQGLALGKWFLSTAISAAWAHKPEKLTIQTNTLDHPAALPLYQKLGFSPVGIGGEQIVPWV